MKSLKDIPPWDWPAGAGAMFLDVLRDGQAAESDRLLAAELAGDLTAIDDELVDALLAVLRSGAESEKLRVRAAISLGPHPRAGRHGWVRECRRRPDHGGNVHHPSGVAR